MFLRQTFGIWIVTCMTWQHIYANVENVQAIFNQVKTYEYTEKTNVENAANTYVMSNEQKMEGANHINGLEPATIAEKANAVIDLAIFFNAKSAEAVANYSVPTEDLKKETNFICPKLSACPTNLKYRPINGACNNILNPRWGSAKIAQTRRVNAEWERSTLKEFQLTKPGLLYTVDPFGVQLTSGPLIFHLAGNVPFRLAVLKPEETCETITCSGDTQNEPCRVPGQITSVQLSKTIKGPCDIDEAPYNGNEVLLPAGCIADVYVCYQPFLVDVTLRPKPQDTSTLQVMGQKTATYTTETLLYPMEGKDYGMFWLDWRKKKLRVGRGSECDERSVILKSNKRFESSLVESLLGESAYKYTIMVGLPSEEFAADTPWVGCKVPVRDNLRLTTHFSDKRTIDGEKSLDEEPWVYNRGSLRFGIDGEIFASPAELDLIDANSGVTVTIVLGAGLNSIKAVQNKNQISAVDLNADDVGNRVTFADYNEKEHSKYRAFWCSWIGNAIYIGTGNVIGTNTIKSVDAKSGSLSINTKFNVDRVVLRSILRVNWLFDIVQINVPRKSSLSGRSLPSTRDISLVVHSKNGQATSLSPKLTMLTFQMGQLVDHDCIATPTESLPQGDPIPCCVDGKPVQTPSRFCFNIAITGQTNAVDSEGSFPLANTTCLPLTRSAAAIECDPTGRDLRTREQLTTITAFVDASNVYGSDENTTKRLRAAGGESELLKTDDTGKELPPATVHGEEACNNADNPAFRCREAGDGRSQEQPSLNGMHTLWMREHNRLARELANQGWPNTTPADKETLFQEARRILIAEMQVVVYGGFLPSFMDEKVMKRYKINEKCDYDSNLNPSIFNEWGIAYRFGHTWINDLADSIGLPLVDSFFNPTSSYVNGSDYILRTMYTHRCPNTDKIMEDSVTENLFRDNGSANDLAALNNQRGRDHGVGTYCNMRRHYGLKVPETFDELVSSNLVDAETVEQLKTVYDCVCDIDLFTAVIMEIPLGQKNQKKSTSIIGELLNEILGDFFFHAKCGDRFWYENKGEKDDYRFDKQQIKALRKTTISRIICDNTDITGKAVIQKDSFTIENTKDNQATDCDTIKKLDLKLFGPPKEKRNTEKQDFDTELRDFDELLDVLDQLDKEREELRKDG